MPEAPQDPGRDAAGGDADDDVGGPHAALVQFDEPVLSEVVFAGTGRDLEVRALDRLGFDLVRVHSAGLKGKSADGLVRGFSTLPLSAWDAWRVITRVAPQVVIGLGGYSSGAVVLIAALRRIPTLVLEQNAQPGITNRLLAPVVTAAAVAATWAPARKALQLGPAELLREE